MKIIFTLTHHNFYIATLILKLEMIIIVIPYWMRETLIRSNDQIRVVELEVPTLRSHILDFK